MLPEWVRQWNPAPSEPAADTPSEVITIGSEFANDEDQGNYSGDAEFGNLNEPLNTNHDSQVTDRDYVCPQSTLRPSRSACTNTSTFTSSSGISEQGVRFYSKEPSLLNFGSGE